MNAYNRPVAMTKCVACGGEVSNVYASVMGGCCVACAQVVRAHDTGPLPVSVVGGEAAAQVVAAASMRREKLDDQVRDARESINDFLSDSGRL